MKAYLVKILDPIQTPAAVYESRTQALKEPLYVLLEHQEEPNVIRGRSQPFEKNGVKEIRRPDGGRWWYHPHTLCLISGEPVKQSTTLTKFQETWGDLLKDFLASQGYDRDNLLYSNADLYLVNGSETHKQIIGTSGWVSRENGRWIKIQRACWYERNPIPDISDMLRADGINPQEFQEKLHLVKEGFFKYLKEELKAKDVPINEFISPNSLSKAYELQKRRNGHLRGSCVLGEKK